MDIVERLLNTRTPGAEALCVEAAHTISRLREENAELRAFKERCEGQAPAFWTYIGENLDGRQERRISTTQPIYIPCEAEPLYRHPVAPEVDEDQIFAICCAYEQGYGKGYDNRQCTNPYAPSWGCDVAWQYGYDEGQKVTKKVSNTPSAAPEV